MSTHPKTFFELVDEKGQSGVARDTGIDKAIIHRCYHLKQGINDDLIAACDTAYGSEFDRNRTLIEWYEGRRSSTIASSSPEASQATGTV